MTAVASPPGPAKPFRRFPGLWLVLPAAALLPVVLVSGCGQAPGAQKGNKPVEVDVTTPITDTVIDYQDFTGRLDAVKTIEIRARVSGYVTEVPFKEGDVVHEGDLLFQIDPRPYQAELDLQEANLKLAEADRNLQEKNVARARRLMTLNSIAKEDYDTAVATWEKSGATVDAMRAARDKAKLNVTYTRVLWEKEQNASLKNGVPHIVSGRISRRYVDPSNMVLADNTLLTTIVTEDPVYAYFDVDERTYEDQFAKEGKVSSSVLIRLANEEEFSEVGTVTFVDNRVNASTGTIRMRAVFQNPTAPGSGSGRLRPGLFVRIRLPIGKPYQALLVPDEALQSDQGKKYLYIVKTTVSTKEDGSQEKQEIADYRPVQLGQALGGLRVLKEARFGLTEEVLKALQTDGIPAAVLSRLEKRKDQLPVPRKRFLKELALPEEELQRYQTAILNRALKDGLRGDEQVLTTGMHRVRSGQPINPQPKEPPARPESPLGKLVKLEAPGARGQESGAGGQ
jgi:RND family efflux transporter MFP subunit